MLIDGEHALDGETAGAAAKERFSRAPSREELDGGENDRFPGAGRAREDVETGAERNAGILDDGEIPYSKLSEHDTSAPINDPGGARLPT